MLCRMKRRGSVNKLMQEENLTEDQAMQIVSGEFEFAPAVAAAAATSSTAPPPPTTLSSASASASSTSTPTTATNAKTISTSRRRSSIVSLLNPYSVPTLEDTMASPTMTTSNTITTTQNLVSTPPPQQHPQQHPTPPPTTQNSTTSSFPSNNSTQRKRLSTLMMQREDVATLLALPPKLLAKEIHTRDKNLAALRRNIEHLIKKNDGDNYSISLLKQDLKDVKASVVKLAREKIFLMKQLKQLQEGANSNSNSNSSDGEKPKAAVAVQENGDGGEMVHSLRLKCSHLEKSLEESESKLKFSFKTNKNVHMRINEASAKIVSLEEIIESKTQLILIAEKNSKELEAEAELIKSTQKDNLQIIDNLNHQIQNLNDNSNFLRDKLESSRSLLFSEKENRREEKETMGGQIIELSKSYNDAKIEVLENEITITNLKDSNEHFEFNTSKLQSSNNDLEISLRNEKAKREALQTERDTKSKAVLKFMGLLDKSNKDRQDSVIKLADHIQRNASKDDKVGDLTQQLVSMSKKLSFLEHDLDVVKGQRDDLEEKLKKKTGPVSSDPTVNALQEARLAEGRSEAIQILQAENDKLLEKKKELRHEKDEIEEQLAVRDIELKDNITQLEKSKADGMMGVVQMKSMEKTAHKLAVDHQNELNKHFGEVDRMKKEIAEARIEIERLTENDLEEEVEGLKKDIQGLNNENSLVNLQNNGLQAEVKILAEEQTRMEIDLNEKTLFSRKIMEEMDVLRGRLGADSKVAMLEREKFEWGEEKRRMEEVAETVAESAEREKGELMVKVEKGKRELAAWRKKCAGYDEKMGRVGGMLEGVEREVEMEEGGFGELMRDEEKEEKKKMKGVIGFLIEKLKVDLRLAILGE